MFGRGQGSETHWFICHWRVRLLTTVMPYAMLICQRKLNKNEKYKTKSSYESLFTIVNMFMEIANPICWEVIILLERLYDRQELENWIWICLARIVLKWFCGVGVTLRQLITWTDVQFLPTGSLQTSVRFEKKKIRRKCIQYFVCNMSLNMLICYTRVA